MYLRKSEFLFWTLMVLVMPWAAYGAYVALVGRPSGDGPFQLALAGFAVALWFAIGGALPWRLAWAVRAPVVAFRLWLARRWRWTFAIAPEPLRHGAHAIWVSRALGPDERHAVVRVSKALEALAILQPSRAARLKRLGVHLAVVPLHSYAAYFPSANLLAVDPAALAESVEALASIIVHESNHALLASRRLVHPLLEERGEQLARLDQRIFGLALLRAGKVAEARRVLDLVRGSARADYGWRARLAGVKASIARQHEGLKRNDG
jgi:hypothetical protein